MPAHDACFQLHYYRALCHNLCLTDEEARVYNKGPALEGPTIYLIVRLVCCESNHGHGKCYPHRTPQDGQRIGCVCVGVWYIHDICFGLICRSHTVGWLRCLTLSSVYEERQRDVLLELSWSGSI